MRHQTLVSLPHAAAAPGPLSLPGADFACGDPQGKRLGSGGGAAHLLAGAWKALGGGRAFSDWLLDRPKLAILAGGPGGRLPAYEVEGLPRIPAPRMAKRSGQLPGQSLLDVQRARLGHLLRHAPASYPLVVACGDVLVSQSGAMPRFPEVDVLVVGIPSSLEEASSHGVLFANPGPAGGIEFFLHKPPAETISRLSALYPFSLDSGVWLLSARAVSVLMAKCGWDAKTATFRRGGPVPYDLFGGFGASLGRNPSCPDPDVAALSAAVLTLPDGRFYHFDSNSSVVRSMAELAAPSRSRRSFGAGDAAAAEDRLVLHGRALGVEQGARELWVENSSLTERWKLAGRNAVTGVPPNDWFVELPRGACVDSVPCSGGEALRAYGFDDVFSGPLSAPSTEYFGRPFSDWLSARGLSFERAGLSQALDIHEAPLFPVVDWSDPSGGDLLRWIVSGPAAMEASAATAAEAAWLGAKRVSAAWLAENADPAPRVARRAALVRADMAARSPEKRAADALALDLAAVAAELAEAGPDAPPPPEADDFAPSGSPAAPPLALVHEAMFVEAATGKAPSPDAFGRLRELLVGDMSLSPVSPRRAVLDNQIVWGRAPARLDIAGGWSDTPPFCLEQGGRVVNVAVDLNGQPPIQAFAAVSAEPHIRLHSIDLGLTETISSYDELCAPPAPGPFAVPRAALRLAGFDPRFAAGAAPSLSEQLRRTMGGGLEISTLAVVPKGSGLGTSAILAATLLGVLSDTCGLGWTAQDLFARSTVLEQLLGGCGGWQDQLGGVLPGAKFAATRPGLHQAPDVRFLPEGMFSDLVNSGRAMLWYTGLARSSSSILSGIVRGMFLNDRRVVSCVEDIACNADFAADAIQRADEGALGEALRRSWDLNRTLDCGTCPDALLPAVSTLERHGAAFKLLGAGGGGYLFAIAPDAASAAAIREEISRNPPAPGARFVALSISRGLQVTRS